MGPISGTTTGWLVNDQIRLRPEEDKIHQQTVALFTGADDRLLGKYSDSKV